jgi:hypothetical protein
MTDRNQISDLIEFVQKATKLAKYNSNTGGGILYAVKAAEKGFLPEEPKDIEYLVSHMEELFLRQKDLNLSPQSQDVYFGRIKKAIEDYKKYGQDARSIYSWSPKIRAKKNTTKKENNNSKEEEEEGTIIDQQPQNRNRHEDSLTKEVGGVKLNILTWRIRPGVLIKIELPENLTKADVDKIKKHLDLEIETSE